MPTKRGEDDKDYQPGFTRKRQGYEPARDNRNMNKELLLLKGKPSWGWCDKLKKMKSE